MQTEEQTGQEREGAWWRACVCRLRARTLLKQWKTFRENLARDPQIPTPVLGEGQAVQVEVQRTTGRKLPGTIASLNDRTMTLALEPPPADPRRALSGPLENTRISVFLTGEDGLYQFNTTVETSTVSREKPDYRLLTVSRPTQFAWLQRRQYSRTRVQLPATFLPISPRPPEAGSVGKSSGLFASPRHATVVSLSIKGFCTQLGDALGAETSAILQAAFAQDTIVQARMPIPALSGTRILARTVSCERIAVRGGIGLRLICVFLSLSSDQQVALENYLLEQGPDPSARTLSA